MIVDCYNVTLTNIITNLCYLIVIITILVSVLFICYYVKFK